MFVFTTFHRHPLAGFTLTLMDLITNPFF